MKRSEREVFQLVDLVALVTKRKHVSLCLNHHRVYHFIEILISAFLVILIDPYGLGVLQRSSASETVFLW
jgi:hypothetical protein